MDLNEVKKQLESLSNKKDYAPKKDYSKIYFSPKVGKHVVRVVPSKVNKEFPFTELLFYYNIGKLKSICSPLNWGEKDPINEFIKELKKSNEKDDWVLSKKLSAKKRYFAPVIVRGEEEKGVRLWQFGKTTYQDLLNLADDKEVGDFTDILEGRDIKLTTVGPETTGTDYNKTSISPALSQTPLSKNKEQVDLWLNEQPVPLEEYHQFSFDEIKDALRSHLSPDEGEEGEIVDEGSEEFDGDNTPKKEYTKTAFPKPTPADDFDKLFEEKE